MNEKLKIYNPFDNSQISTIDYTSENAVDTILINAQRCFNKIKYYGFFPKSQRINILEKIIQKIENEKEEISELAAREGGKPIRDSRIEIMRAINGIKIAIAFLLNENIGSVPMELNTASENRISFIRSEPIGIIFGISAFNHPFNLIIHQAITAIAAGCPVIIKPDLRTPLSALKLYEICIEAGLDKDFFNVIIIENSLAEKIASDNRINYLSFIGSAKVGWYLRSIVSPGVRVSLEHGGIAAAIIDDFEIKEDWINSLVKGCFYHSGQVCVSTQRIFVNKIISNEFISKFLAKVKEIKIGNQLLEETDAGPLITKRELNRITSWVQEAIFEGAKLLIGGSPSIDNPKSCYEPTVLLNPHFKSKVSSQEIFGPVVSIFEYNSIEDAIRHANETNYYFQASIFTNNIDNAISTASKLSAQNVMINDHTAFRTDWMPFGGARESGLQLGGIPYTIKEYTLDKMYVLNTKLT